MFEKFKKKLAIEVFDAVLAGLFDVIIDHNQTIGIKKAVGVLDDYEVGIGSGLRMARGKVSEMREEVIKK